jgi:diguanylate cyclase (GGDEF)-like protein
MATTDPLTGISNRQRVLDDLDVAVETARRDGAWLGVCEVDLDHFKQVNDTHGHDIGDLVLVTVAERLSARLQEGELLGRVGGEEFLLGMPRLDLAEAAARAEDFRGAVEALPAALPDGSALAVTASFGVAATYGSRCSVETLRSAADRALYEAKAGGRNAVRTTEVGLSE